MKSYLIEKPATRNSPSHELYYSFKPEILEDENLGIIHKVDGNWNKIRYICSKKNNLDQKHTVIFDTNTENSEKVKQNLEIFFKAIENYKQFIYNEFVEFYNDLLHNLTVYNGKSTWGFEIDDEMKEELVVETFEDFNNKIYSIDLVVEEYEGNFIYYFHIQVWSGEYFFEERGNANLLFVFQDKRCVYKGFDIENSSSFEEAMVNINSHYLNKLKIIRQIENFFSKTDKTELNKEILIKSNSLLLYYNQKTNFYPLSFAKDRLTYEKNKDNILFKEICIEKLIEILMPQKEFSNLLNKVNVLETDNDLFLVKKEKHFGEENVYEIYSYSTKLKSEISFSIFTEKDLEKNLIKEIILKTRELYEKHNNSIITAISDYYIENYFDKSNYQNGLFDEIFLEENYPIIYKNKDIKRLITIPNIWIENLDDYRNNKFKIIYETKFGTRTTSRNRRRKNKTCKHTILKNKLI